MIQKIGIICQDANSRGFLEGLKTRLGCSAELIPVPIAVGKSVYMTKRQSKIAWAYLRKQGVDLIIRFTDADDARRQDVQRGELKTFPDAAQSIFVCGVAVRNTEHWLNLDPQYLAEKLGLSSVQRTDRNSDPTGLIKSALSKIRRPEEKSSDVVARLIQEAPSDVFKIWLRNKSLQEFYSDCRQAALRAECDVPNEL